MILLHIFFFVIVLIECVSLSYFLNKTWWNNKIYGAIFISNLTSYIAELVGSSYLFGFKQSFAWFPYVIGYTSFKWHSILLYLITFISTVVIEAIINLLILRKRYQTLEIIRTTFLINVISYLIGSFILYYYSSLNLNKHEVLEKTLEWNVHA